MAGSHADLVTQQLATVLGTLEIALPPGAVLEPDPGATDGAAWWWTPGSGVGVLSVSHGDAEPRTPDYLLVLERGLEGNEVVVLRDEPGIAEDERQLEYVTTRRYSHGPAVQHMRFRFWQRAGLALRVGYRINEHAEPEWREPFDRIVDEARLR